MCNFDHQPTTNQPPLPWRTFPPPAGPPTTGPSSAGPPSARPPSLGLPSAGPQPQTVLALYEQESIRNNEQPSFSRLKTPARRHIDQAMRTRNFRARNEIVERAAITKSQKKKEQSHRGEESRRMLSVENNWTMFERRLM